MECLGGKYTPEKRQKKQKNMEPENSSWKRRKHLKAPIFGFHVIVFGGVLLLQFWKAYWMFPQEVQKGFFLKTFDDWDMIPIGFFCGLAFFFVMPQPLCENVSPPLKLTYPREKNGISQKGKYNVPPFFRC